LLVIEKLGLNSGYTATSFIRWPGAQQFFIPLASSIERHFVGVIRAMTTVALVRDTCGQVMEMQGMLRL
jgi:hypothetical protein